jgi:hypothetical protein
MRNRRAKDLVLDLASLAKGMPALTPAMGRVQAECAAVCLNEHKHGQEVDLSVGYTKPRTYRLRRQPVTQQMQQTHNDLDDAVEFAACGVAILLVRDLTGLTVIERSWKGTGFDYWMGEGTESGLPFQNMARLEVSGIRRGTPGQIATRVQKKKAQTKRSDATGYKAYAIVVEFSRPHAEVGQR